MARIEATADNAFTLKVNGKQVLSGDNFNIIYAADILSVLRSGRNTIRAIASNASDTPNPAGFIAAMRLSWSDGTSEMIVTDQKWNASRDGVAWSAAGPLGPGPMSPWHLKKSVTTATSELYPDYATTATVLAGMGVPADFQSDGPVRFTHRRTDEREIYFIANTANQKVEAICTFRVQQGIPQLWDPVTAQIRALPQYTCQEQTTSVPVVLEPYQSFFVVFARRDSPKPVSTAGSVNFPEARAMTALEGPWEVSFDPKWGGPKKISFEALQDWSEHTKRGIRYYSGIATYRKTSNLARQSGKRMYLDLGTVHDMARVKLNGRDLGVVWCAPWRVDITEVVQAEGNILEIDIANRWPNRLLGDQQAPDRDVRTVQWESGFLEGKEFKTGRYTFTTGRGPGQLMPSGLLGPVRILVGPT